MAVIDNKKFILVKTLYEERGLSMREIAERLGVSIDAVVYFMRKNNIARKSFSEINRIRFERKKPSFSLRKKSNQKTQELGAMGAMLYWAEGYKTEKSTGVDFANSDPYIVNIFVTFLRSRYKLDEKRMRAFVYCYPDQDVRNLTKFWSKVTGIPISQFTKPYVRKDFRSNGRKMNQGLVHVRYADKKLLIDILNLIESYKQRFASVVP